MILREVRAQSFRGFESVSFALSETGRTLVYGANNAGKSALASTLDVVAGLNVLDIRRRGSAEAAVVVAKFYLAEDEARYAVQHMQPREDYWFTEYGGAREATFTFVERDGVAKLHRVSLKLNDFGAGTIAEARSSGPYSYDLYGIPTNTPIDQWQDGENLQNRVTNVPDADLRGIREVMPSLELLEKWRSEYFHFPAVRQTATRDVQISNDGSLTPDGSNLGGVLVWLQLNDPPRWQQLVKAMRDLVPGLGLPQTPTDGAGMAQIAIRDDMQHVLNLESMGAGVAQLLMILTLGVLRDRSSLLVVEEPETGLHPAAQRGLAELLERWGSDRQILITSHSTVFLSGADEPRVLLVRRVQNVSSAHELEAGELVEVSHALGARLVDALVADRVLIVEGISDLEILKAWYPKINRDPRIAVVLAEGGNSAHVARRFSEWLNQADRLEDRKVVFVRDRDEISDAEVNRLTESGAVSVLPVREIENFLLSPEGLSQFFEQECDIQIDPVEVESILRVAADELRPSVVLRTVAREQVPIRLCDDRARTALVRAEAGVDELVAHIVAQVPDSSTLEAVVRTRWDEVDNDLSARWEKEWIVLAPGEEMLTALFAQVVKRGYSKVEDGPKVAKYVGAPAVLDEVLGPLLGLSSVDSFAPDPFAI